jgi:peptide/nickel transport system substrate-binding protein
MDREVKRQLDEYRSNEAGPLENNLIDELRNGELDRHEFLRRGAMFGLSAGIMGSLLAYVGEAGAAPVASVLQEAVKKGGTLRIGMLQIGGSLEPYKLNDGGSLGFSGIPGEYLTFSDKNLKVQPWLATSWKPNKDGSVWTFQLRKGVKFHNGKTMTSDDVVACFKQYTSKGSNALAALGGVLTPEGVSKKGPNTVVFRLVAPNGAFPALVSQTTYMTIIQPAEIAAKPDTWVASGMIGTGAFKLKSYSEKRSAELVRFPQYWGGPAPLDGLRLTFYESSTPAVLALKAGQIDLAQQLTPPEAAPFANNSRFTVYALPTSAHRMFCMRVDQAPFTDARVRRAVALVLNRPDLISRLLLGKGTLGNDSPFWKQFPSTDPSTKQRVQNVELAKSLLKAAGQENLKFTITTHKLLELPDYAAAIQAAAKAAGIDVSIEVQADGEYYSGVGGGDYYTTTPWLNRPATLTEYGARGVPNQYMTSAYLKGGAWNASHYDNPVFASAAKSFLTAGDIQTQRKATKLMQGLLLRDTPVVTAYFITYTTASSSKVKNYVPEGLSHVRVAKTFLA